jgi:hypothetical protein
MKRKAHFRREFRFAAVARERMPAARTGISTLSAGRLRNMTIGE